MAPLEDDEAFNVAEAFQQVPVDPETKKKDEKAKRRAEKRSKDLEEKRKINREHRQKRKEEREKNKKRKRGEAVSEDEEEQPPTKKGKEEGESTKNESTDKDKYGIWVGNFNYNTPKWKIVAFFQKCGGIQRIKCPKGTKPGLENRGYAFINFTDEKGVENALAKNETILDDRPLLIKRIDDYERVTDQKKQQPATEKEEQQQQSSNPPCPTLFLGNLPFATTERHIRAAFRFAGFIERVRVATFQDSGKCKGFAYVDFRSLGGAMKAMEKSEYKILSRKIRVEYASEEAYKRGHPWLLREEAKKKAETSKSGPMNSKILFDQDEENGQDEAENGEASSNHEPKRNGKTVENKPVNSKIVFDQDEQDEDEKMSYSESSDSSYSSSSSSSSDDDSDSSGSDSD